MAKVTNKFYIQAIHDGSSIYAELVSSGQLVQTISDKGVVNPDWTVAANQPILYPQTKLNGTYKGCSGHWYYNDKVLTEVIVSGVTYYTFQNDGVTGNDYFFKKDDQTIGGITWPGLRIIRNLAGVNGNYDNDVIRFDGTTEESGHGIDFSVSRAIRITRYTGTGNYGLVLGGNKITSDVNTTVVYAQLYDSNTGAALSPSSYKTKWFRDGVDASNAPHWSSTNPPGGVNVYTSGEQPQAAITAGVTLPENCQWISVGLADVDDNATLRCVFLSATDDSELYTAWGSVDDETDGFQMQIRCDSVDYIGADYIELRAGQDADMKCWMSNNLDPTTEYGGFTKFMCKLYDNHNTLITVGTDDQDSPLYGKTVETDPSDPKYGYFDITQQNMPVYSNTSHSATIITASKGGKLTLKYDYIDRPNDATTGKKGGDGAITGYFLALSEQDVNS